VVAILDTAGCPLNTIACGFVEEQTAVIYDATGAADFVEIEAVGPGVATVRDLAGSRIATYAAGTQIAEALQITYFHDPAARQLRRAEGGTSFVVADNVISASFEYFADGLISMPLASLGDGPFAGSGSTAFDVDLLRVRTVRATLRFETGVDSMRGGNPALFARPGTSAGTRVIPDLVTGAAVALRN
jgi:hypothetical protein